MEVREQGGARGLPRLSGFLLLSNLRPLRVISGHLPKKTSPGVTEQQQNKNGVGIGKAGEGWGRAINTQSPQSIPRAYTGGDIHGVHGGRIPPAHPGQRGDRAHMGRSSRWPHIRRLAWERDRKAQAPCHICGQPINYLLEPSSAPNAWEPDHLIPVSKRPDLELDLLNIAASHAQCNRSRGDGTNGENILGQQSRIW